jgi:hypothetical protein
MPSRDSVSFHIMYPGLLVDRFPLALNVRSGQAKRDQFGRQIRATGCDDDVLLAVSMYVIGAAVALRGSASSPTGLPFALS